MDTKPQHNHNRKKTHASRRNGPSIITIVIIIILIVIIGLLLTPYVKKYLADSQSQKTTITDKVVEKTVDKKPDDTQQPVTSIDKPPVEQEQTMKPVIEPLDTPEQTPTAPPEKTIAQICEEISTPIVTFYDHLDRQTYIQNSKLESQSGVYFTSLIQKLLDNPPVVTRETDDLFTILQNTAHFFRIIGKKNIMVIKGILHNEKAHFENIVAKYFDLVHQPKCSMKDLVLKPTDQALYDYAGFFLNTMGGRLYLFRRDSQSRMVIIYYSLLIVDQANINGKNRHGIQISHAIDSLIDEIESVGQGLKMREQYLDKLYDLQEKYQQ